MQYTTCRFAAVQSKYKTVNNHKCFDDMISNIKISA